ncbi:hypothetical protein [Celerinatantimonas sp. YJH-8]|uniref:hypothetical protein n=1 Tax=Celerinatantimonas sp. YJH-8 TaxID=3228714 RepID=UPI0038CA1EBC
MENSKFLMMSRALGTVLLKSLVINGQALKPIPGGEALLQVQRTMPIHQRYRLAKLKAHEEQLMA